MDHKTSPTLVVRVKRLSGHAALPRYATDGSGAFDIQTPHAAMLSTQAPAMINTGLAFEVPPGHVMLVFSRSGHGFTHGVRLSNCVGVIDSDYRGELRVKLIRDEPGHLQVRPGDRVAQGIILRHPRIEFEEAGELSQTSRGDRGLGSTGR